MSADSIDKHGSSSTTHHNESASLTSAQPETIEMLATANAKRFVLHSTRLNAGPSSNPARMLPDLAQASAAIHLLTNITGPVGNLKASHAVGTCA